MNKLNKATNIIFIFLSLFFISFDGFSTCLPGTITGYNNYPIAAVVNGKLWFGRISPTFSSKTADVYFENNVTNKIEYSGNYSISNINASPDCYYYWPYVYFKISVFGDDGNTWVSMYKESDTIWTNTVLWAGKCYERSNTVWPQNIREVDCP